MQSIHRAHTEDVLLILHYAGAIILHVGPTICPFQPSAKENCTQLFLLDALWRPILNTYRATFLADEGPERVKWPSAIASPVGAGF